MQPSQIATTQPATVIAKLQQPSRPSSVSAQPASILVVDDQQAGNSRHLMFTLSPAKTVNPPSVASGQQEESQHNTSGLSSLFGGIPSELLYQQITTHHNHFYHLNFKQLRHQCHLPLIKKSQDLQPVQPAESAQISRSACIKSHQPTILRATPIFQKQLLSYLLLPKNKKSTPSNTYPSLKYTKKV